MTKFKTIPKIKILTRIFPLKKNIDCKSWNSIGAHLFSYDDIILLEIYLGDGNHGFDSVNL